MSIQRIAQPYLVYIDWDDERDSLMTTWLEENILEYYLVLVVGTGSHIIPAIASSRAVVEKLEKPVVQFQFTCPRDAMLFKLTWGGN